MSVKNSELSIFKLLVSQNSSINSDSQIEIMAYLFDIFVQYNKDLLLIDNGEISIIRGRKAFETLAEIKIKMKFPEVKIKAYNEHKKSYKWDIKISDIFDVITSINSYSLLKYESDVFRDEQIIIKDKKNSIIKVITNDIHIKSYNDEITEKYSNEYLNIVDDYKAHFPQFDELLKLIIDMRFAKDRKASFLHLRVKSNWGKSFLGGLLKNIEIAIEVDYANLMNKGANDIAPIQVRNSFVMIIDEFNNFSAEMKKLSHSFAFAPKFGMREDCELYLKILMSAEKSPSFQGGVDTQILNRVMTFDIDDKETTELTDRAVYKQYGNALYMECLELYATLQLQERIFYYMDLGKFEAHKVADKNVKEAYLKYKMKNSEDLNKLLKNVIEDYILNSSEKEFKSPIDENIIKIFVGKYKDKYFIKSPLKVFEHILKTETSETELKKLRYKLSSIYDILDVVAVYNNTKLSVNGSKKSRGVVLNVEETLTAREVLEDLKANGNLQID